MSVPESKIIAAIEHYQKSISKHEHNKEKLLYYLNKLGKFPMTVSILEKTMVGLQINALRKYDGDVGNAAKVLVTKWKDVVRRESEGDFSDEEMEEEKEEVGNHGNHSDDSGVDNDDLEDGDRDSDDRSGSDFNKYSNAKPIKEENDQKRSDRKSKEEDKHSSSRKNKHSDKHKSSNHESVKSSRESSSKKSRHESSKSRHESKSNHSNSSLNKSRHESKKRKYSDSESDSDQNDSDSSESTRSSKRRKVKKESSDDGDSESESHSSHSDSSEKKMSHDKREKKTQSSQNHHTGKSRSSSSHKKADEPRKSESKRSSSKTSQSSERRKDKELERSSTKDKHSKSIEHHRSKSVTDKPKTEVKIKAEKDDSKPSKNGKDSQKSQSPVKVKQEKDSMAANSFEMALMGFSSPGEQSKVKAKSKSSSKSGSSSEKKSSQVSESKCSKMVKSPSGSPAEVDLFPEIKSDLDRDIASSLPELADVYRPLPQLEKRERPKLMSEDEALASIMTTKNQRTKVYSGNKAFYTKVPSLFELCTRVLIDNIDLLEYTGGVPYDILKPIIERASPDQLFNLEYHNDYLKVDTDEHWKFHCQRDFRDKTRKDDETWRDLYVRCIEERQKKLERLTNNISRSIAESAPVRKTKLAYVDSAVKPPRNILRKQAKNGTGSSSTASCSKHDIIAKAVKGEGSSSKGSGSEGSCSKASGSEGPVRVGSPSMQRAEKYVHTLLKKKKAPLMQKALQLIKGNRFKR